MLSLSDLKRRSIVPLAGLMLAAYYFIVLRPLAHRADSLDAPLREAWQKLVTSLELTNAGAVDFLHLTNQLAETRQSLILLENAKQKAGARLELGAVVRARMNAPFQLVEYEDERSKEVDALTKLAKTQQVTIEPAVFAGFPEQTAETRQPLILWPALSFIDQLLTAALQCKVSSIHSLELPLNLTNAVPASGATRLAEIPLHVELTGAVANVGRFLQTLPLRADELRAAGLPEISADKAPLFIDRLIIRKQSPDKVDEVRVWLRAVGFVLRE